MDDRLSIIVTLSQCNKITAGATLLGWLPMVKQSVLVAADCVNILPVVYNCIIYLNFTMGWTFPD